MRPLLIVLAVAATGALTLRGCAADRSNTAASIAPEPVAVIPARHALNPASCDEQARRFAEGPVWRRSATPSESDRPLRWTAHFSPKYDACYMLVERRGDGGALAVVSELWDAVEIEVLAEYTHDSDAAVRRRHCQVTLSEDPFTSCAVAQYFIDEHMRH